MSNSAANRFAWRSIAAAVSSSTSTTVAGLSPNDTLPPMDSRWRTKCPSSWPAVNLRRGTGSSALTKTRPNGPVSVQEAGQVLVFPQFSGDAALREQVVVHRRPRQARQFDEPERVFGQEPLQRDRTAAHRVLRQLARRAEVGDDAGNPLLLIREVHVLSPGRFGRCGRAASW